MNQDIYNRNKADMYMQAGRMLYEEDELEILKKQIEKKVNAKIQELCNKVTIWDIDGTLCRFKYTEGNSDKLLPCKDADLGTYLRTYNMYNNAEPLRIMQYIINNCNSDLVYTLSTSTEPAKLQKNEWLKKYYPSIKENHIYYSSCDAEKLIILEHLLTLHPGREVVFIEDTAKTLLNVEELYPQIKLQHISEFLI